MLNTLELDSKKIFLIVVVCMTFLRLDFVLLMKGQLNKVKELSKETTKLKKDLDKLQGNLSKTKDFKNKQIEVEKNIHEKSKIIIAQSQLVELLKDISAIANQNNIQIIQIRPVRGMQIKPGTGSDGASSFLPVSITLDLLCDYHNFGKFLNDLEKSRVFTAVISLNINPRPPDFLKQRVALILKTYVKE